MFRWWVAWRFLVSEHKNNFLTTFLAIVGMALGVASLVVAMAVVSGYEGTLKKSVIDIFGHLIVVKSGPPIQDFEAFEEKIRDKVPGVQGITPFLYMEAILAHHKKLTGVVVQGVDPSSVGKVLNLHKHLVQGDFQWGVQNGIPVAFVGKGLQKKYQLKLGDVFRVVIPSSDPYNVEKLRPRVQVFRVGGVLNFGRHDFDSRTLVTNLFTVQKMAQMKGRFVGVRIKFEDERIVRKAAFLIEDLLGPSYWTKSWKQVNRNLFEAVKYEKVVIFLVVLIIVIAASFNISNALLVSVLRKYRDIGVLKSFGGSDRFILGIFARQGLLVGGLGAIMGVVLGLLACWGFLWAQQIWPLIPGEVYKIDHISVEIRMLDLSLILGVSLLICFLSVLAPARRGARLLAVEGLRYE
ncbi:MAG: FtsX-like permease family protein [Bdellovibrio sp.]|nr:MAG: FtsX-like permease family protein [Bdellovibrio sp.]